MPYPSLIDSVRVSFHVGSPRVVDIRVLLAPVAIKYLLEVPEQSEIQVLVHYDHLTSNRFSFWNSAINIAHGTKSCQLMI